MTDTKPETATTDENYVWRVRTALLVLFFTIIRVFLVGRVGLGDSESYYWTWSRHMALSYYDHPPVVAWLIRLSTYLGGDTPFWVRFPSIVIFVGICWILYKTAVEIFDDPEIGFSSVLILNLTPVFAFGALQMVPDIPAAFCWILFVYLLVKILKGGNPLLWYAVGATVGVGLLSKYMLVPLIPSTLLLLAWHKEHRKHLRGPHIYLGGVLGLLIFSPVLIWNFAHDFPSFKFHLVDRNQAEHFSLNHMGQFIAGQGVYMSPFLWFGLLYVAWLVYKEAFARGDDRRFVPVFWTTVPSLVFFYLIGLYSKTSEPHWSAFAYLILMVAWAAFYKFNKPRWNRYTFGSLGFSAVMIAMVYVHTLVPFLPIKPKYDITNELYGWDVVGKALEEELSPLPGEKEKYVAAHHWVMCSQIEFATRHRHKVFCKTVKTTEFDFFPDTTPPTGADLIFVADKRFEDPPEAFYLFDRSEKARKITIFRGGQPVREFQLYRVFGYKGLK